MGINGESQPRSVPGDERPDQLPFLCNACSRALSTREPPPFRDHLVPLGITTMSAGSRTNPGGHALGHTAGLEQFEISDDRPPAQVAEALRAQGYEPVWKDWTGFGVSP